MVRHSILIFLVFPFIFGCRATDPSVELLEGELRWMEDQVYMLEHELERKCDELSSCRQSHMSSAAPRVLSTVPGGSNGLTVEQLPAPDGQRPSPATRPRTTPRANGQSSGSGTKPPIRTKPASPPPMNLPETSPEDDSNTAGNPRGEEVPKETPIEQGDETEMPDMLEPPTIVIPEQGGYESETLAPPTESRKAGTPPVLDEPLPSPGGASEIEGQAYFQPITRHNGLNGVDADVSHIVVTTRVPVTADGDVPQNKWVIADESEQEFPAGSPMLQVIVQPRNADGIYVGLPGPVSVVILDSSQSGDDARVGRWDFDVAHCRRMLRKTKPNPGIHLEIPWAEIARVPADLHMFVRYTSVDGRELEDEVVLATESEKFEDGQWTPSLRPSSKSTTPGNLLPSWAPNR